MTRAREAWEACADLQNRRVLIPDVMTGHGGKYLGTVGNSQYDFDKSRESGDFHSWEFPDGWVLVQHFRSNLKLGVFARTRVILMSEQVGNKRVYRGDKYTVWII